ncbi:malonic semialdehyde reductase [Sphingomonas changnyeongensis]|uniref:Putative NADH dehydrogenase/NAD(P)H nitroreductase GVO57_06630 n=1 Tax=Sphingomonas changnyeongensis TaxID=2698679 RepID=A0A7Z2NW63_9SPHN|nr:malonic semialdehyde reductase [Sphingomonas changnyeongensis]QHL90566.1 malonic semialdehyde reductase [Sphingomonas changnyeongensis]
MGELPQQALDQLFFSARSYNGYLDKPVPQATLERIWELMKMGPTSANILPARIIWCTSDAAKQKLAACASAQNQPKILSAPVTVIIGMDLDFPETVPELFPHNPGAKDWFADPVARETAAFRNSSLQGGYFILAARAVGLDTGPMSGFDNQAVDAAFFAGTAIRSNFISTLGHGDPASIFPRLPRPGFDRFNTIV